MSDLIEKLKQRIREIASCHHADYRNEFYGSLGRFVCENTHDILSALETVRGIEEIMQNETHFSLYRGGFKYYVQVRNSDRSVDFMRRVPVEEGPSAAIEAARKQ